SAGNGLRRIGARLRNADARGIVLVDVGRLGVPADDHVVLAAGDRAALMGEGNGRRAEEREQSRECGGRDQTASVHSIFKLAHAYPSPVAAALRCPKHRLERDTTCALPISPTSPALNQSLCLPQPYAPHASCS